MLSDVASMDLRFSGGTEGFIGDGLPASVSEDIDITDVGHAVFWRLVMRQDSHVSYSDVMTFDALKDQNPILSKISIVSESKEAPSLLLRVNAMGLETEFGAEFVSSDGSSVLLPSASIGCQLIERHFKYTLPLNAAE
jgi:hypothetical protein